MENNKPQHKTVLAGIIIAVVAIAGIAGATSPKTPEATQSVNPPPATATAAPESPSTGVLPAQNSIPAPEPTAAPVQSSTLSNDNYYTNTAGNEVHSPAYSNTVPAGATAQCKDGTYSFSQSRRGTCSSHGGVATWL